MTTETWKRGETIDKVLTVATDGVRRDLTTASAVELQVKTALDGADPPLISLAVGFGITLRAQVGDDVGKADVRISSTQTQLLAPGTYWYDVAVDFPTGRKYVVGPTKLVVTGVVNQPPAGPSPIPAPASAPQDQTERSFVWTATASTNLQTVTIPGGMRDASYVITAFRLRDPAPGDGVHPEATFPAAGRTSTTFQVATDAPIVAGSVYDVAVRDA